MHFHSLSSGCEIAQTFLFATWDHHARMPMCLIDDNMPMCNSNTQDGDSMPMRHSNAQDGDSMPMCHSNTQDDDAYVSLEHKHHDASLPMCL